MLDVGRLSVAFDKQGCGLETALLQALEQAGGDDVDQFSLFTGDLFGPSGLRYAGIGAASGGGDGGPHDSRSKNDAGAQQADRTPRRLARTPVTAAPPVDPRPQLSIRRWC